MTQKKVREKSLEPILRDDRWPSVANISLLIGAGVMKAITEWLKRFEKIPAEDSESQDLINKIQEMLWSFPITVWQKQLLLAHEPQHALYRRITA